MDQLTPCLAVLLDPFASCFRVEVAATFRRMFVAWIVCLGRRTISRVWETTGPTTDQCHWPAFRLFNDAVWNWDEVGRILLVKLLATFVPGCRLWLVVDDTLCHKRGAKVAFGGVFLDAVLSSKKHKTFRFANNWVTLGLVVELPMRKDRFFCLNLLWRVNAKKDKNNPDTHRTKPQLAREMVELVASWLPGRQLLVLGDSAYMSQNLLKGLPGNVCALGPVHWKAGLTQPLPDGYLGRRKKGTRLTTPTEAMTDDRWVWQEVVVNHPKGQKKLQVKRLAPCCWYDSVGQRLLQVVLVRDPEKKWRDEALLCSVLDLSAEEVIVGYVRRWSVEVAYGEGKQMLGFHDPMVWSEKSVTRSHPMVWFVGSLVILWYVHSGVHQTPACRYRPWYEDKVTPTFADMLACCRLALWQNWLKSEPSERERKLRWLLEYAATAA